MSDADAMPHIRVVRPTYVAPGLRCSPCVISTSRLTPAMRAAIEATVLAGCDTTHAGLTRAADRLFAELDARGVPSVLVTAGEADRG